MKKQQYADIEEGFFNFVTDYINQPKVTPEPVVTIPKGGIIIWSGAANAIPNGWALCDGTNGTPDLRGKFIVGGIAGSGFNSIGNRGGVTDITLQAFHLPAHTHSGSVSVSGSTGNAGSHAHSYRIGALGNFNNSAADGNASIGNAASTAGAGDHTHTVSASGTYKTNDGDQPTKGQSFSILPPYYALAYIMKL